MSTRIPTSGISVEVCHSVHPEGYGTVEELRDQLSKMSLGKLVSEAIHISSGGYVQIGGSRFASQHQPYFIHQYLKELLSRVQP